MADSSAAARTAGAPVITTTVKLVGSKDATPQGFEHGPTKLASALTTQVEEKFAAFVQSGTVSLYRVPDTKKIDAKTRFIENKHDAQTNFGAMLVDTEETLSANSFLLAIGILHSNAPAAAPSSAPGQCPHSMVFPSVARSSLTWSRCFVAPLYRGRKRWGERW
jgi:hypothetical protein